MEDLVKDEILARFGVTKYWEGQAPRSQLFDLAHLTRKWLWPDLHSAERLIEILVLDRFTRGLPPKLSRWVSRQDPATYDNLVDLVERYVTAREMVQTPGEDGHRDKSRNTQGNPHRPRNPIRRQVDERPMHDAPHPSITNLCLSPPDRRPR
uniref:SCAN box domain-containing protein n=1 Tax=Pelusios castaneus TaxID=367368 RepID=A0A8C8R8X3_9SAUR